MDKEDSEQPAVITLEVDQQLQLQPSEFNLLPSFSDSSCASVGLLAVIPENPHHPLFSFLYAVVVSKGDHFAHHGMQDIMASLSRS